MRDKAKRDRISAALKKRMGSFRYEVLRYAIIV